MKFLASIVAALAVANPVPATGLLNWKFFHVMFNVYLTKPMSADDPAPAPASSSEGNTMDTDIIMINMNSANIQVN